MGDPDLNKEPKQQAGDYAYSAMKAVFSQMPVVGGLAAELFSAVITPPLVRRRDEWVRSIWERLEALERQFDEFSVESLSQNDIFVTTTMHASQIALRSHQEDKLEALRNAVLNSALPDSPSEDLQLMFLSYVDAFTPWHIKFLSFSKDPVGWVQEHEAGNAHPKSKDVGTPMNVFHGALLVRALLSGYGPEFLAQVVADLRARGLIRLHPSDREQVLQGGGETFFASAAAVSEPTLKHAPSLTSIGERFLDFITSPLDDDRGEVNPSGT